MKKIRLNVIVALFTALFVIGCSDRLQNEDINLDLNIEQEVYSDEYVTQKQALEIAEKFFSKEGSAGTRTTANARVITVRDEKSNSPAMHAVTYNEGGFVIISASKEYFPILAYSDENEFDMEIALKSGVAVWLEETKEVIRATEYLDAETKSKIQELWRVYDASENKIYPSSQTRSWTDFNNRISQLNSLYPGWFYTDLATAYSSGTISSSTYNSLYAIAQNHGAQTQYTIVAFKPTNTTVITSQKGPLLATAWGQQWPYNAACGPYGSPANPSSSSYPENYVVGCVAVAMAQIMAYHKKPASTFIPVNHPQANIFHPNPGWSNIFNWTSGGMAVSWGTSLPKLLRAVGESVYVTYGLNSSSVAGSSISQATKAFKDTYGYTTVTYVTHNTAELATVKNNITLNRPVYMRGTSSAGGHAWICDGVKETEYIYQFFAEFYYSGSYNNYGYYTPSNPGTTTSPFTAISYYNMNWGWTGSANGWFFENDVNPIHATLGQLNFQSNRENIYITP